MFHSTQTKSVFEKYEERRRADQKLMADLGPEGFKRRDEFLLSVGPEVGSFLHSLILAKRPKTILEFGTSYGYSTLFLADAAHAVGARVITLELADYKQAYAAEMLAQAGLNGVVEFQLGDAIELAGKLEQSIDFALIDIWKELYVGCLEIVHPKLSDEAILAADNMISPEMARPEVRAYRAAVQAKPDLQTTLLPIGAGIELSVKWADGNVKL